MSHVLVVEDHADTCRLLTRLLHKAGHTVACAGNGREGTAALSGARTDVVVLDLMMPDMDGVEFLETIRSYARWRSLPVILVTGAGDKKLVRSKVPVSNGGQTPGRGARGTNKI
jgi:CheY-like chemotaxis protein